MNNILTLSLIGFLVNILGMAAGPAIVYDLVDIGTDNFQGDIIVISGLDRYNWGRELGYLNAKGFADKNKKSSGVLAIRFMPLNNDGTYCKINDTCSWEEQRVEIVTDTKIYSAYLPAGDSYNTFLYFYVTEDGSTYWAKSGHTEGPNSHIDLSFNDASVEEHLARAAPKLPVEPSEEEKKVQLEEDVQLARQSHVFASVGFCLILVFGYMLIRSGKK